MPKEKAPYRRFFFQGLFAIIAALIARLFFVLGERLDLILAPIAPARFAIVFVLLLNLLDYTLDS